MHLHPRHDWTKRSGSALFLAVALIGFVSLIGFTTFVVSETDFRITNNKVSSAHAFHQADAGIQFVKGTLERELESGQTMSAASTNINIQAPAGLGFDDVDEMAQLSDSNLYAFTVTGRHRGARAKIEAVVKQALAIDLGLFGDQQLYLSPNIDIYSYYSELVPNPTAANSVGGAVAGSNESLVIKPGVTIDGHYVIGETPLGATGTYPMGYPLEEVGRIDPDPMGALGGMIENEILQAQTQNDNNTTSAISGNKLIINNHQTANLSSGNYYLVDIQLKSGSTLNIDASSGPVTFYLEGGAETWPNCIINVAGDPEDFRILSNSTQLIWFRPNNELRMFLYAPYAPVQLWPNGSLYGAVWADNVDLQPNGDIYIDLSLLEKMKSHRIAIVSWKEIRN
jgi:hypothetical protein